MVFEIIVNQKTFLINEDNILYVQLGDGSVPQNEALKVDIVMLNDIHITITYVKHSDAKSTYEKIKKLILLNNLQDLTL